jgi:hypothetical protein
MKNFKKLSEEQRLVEARSAVFHWMEETSEGKRNVRLILMAANDVTLEQIGKKFNITRERARQLIELLGPKELIEYRKLRKHKICKECGELASVNPKYTLCWPCHGKQVELNKTYWSRLHRSMACSDCGRSDKPHRVRGMCEACYHRWAYANLPGRKEMSKRTGRNWRKNNPERTLEINKKAIKAYLGRIRKDPKKYRIYLDKLNARHREKMKDPKYREKMKKYYRLRHRARKLNSKNK